MTTEHDAKPVVARKSRRPHPAKNARLITAGAAAGLTFGVVAALAISDASVATRAAADVAVAQVSDTFAPLNASSTPTAANVTVVRRIHYLPSVAMVASIPTTVASPAVRAVPVVFTPQPPVRASVKSVALPPKRSVVRRAFAAKRQVLTRQARRATRAS